MGEPDRLTLSWVQVQAACQQIALGLSPASAGVYGIPRGGCVPAALIATHLSLAVLEEPVPGCIVVDDLVDSGATIRPFAEAGHRCVVLARKSWSPLDLGVEHYLDAGERWVVFPWEVEEPAVDSAAMRLLQAVGADTTHDGAIDVARAIRAIAEASAILLR